MGRIYLSKYVDYTSALQMFSEALKLYEVADSKEGMAEALYLSSKAYLFKGEIEKVLTPLTKSIEIWKELGNKIIFQNVSFLRDM